MNSEADNVIGLYERHATNWDEDRGNHLFEKPWLDQFSVLLTLGSSILDIGCGSAGPITRFLLEQEGILTLLSPLRTSKLPPLCGNSASPCEKTSAGQYFRPAFPSEDQLSGEPDVPGSVGAGVAAAGAHGGGDVAEGTVVDHARLPGS
jgi:hypothetical protein